MDIAIFVFAWKRLASLKRLVASLQSAEYCDGAAAGRLSLTFLIDVGASPRVEAYARSVTWLHGPIRVVVEQPAACTGAPSEECGGGRGIRGMWIDVMARELEAHEPPSAHLLPLEDDIEVSPLYFYWLRRAADAYGPFDSPAGISSAWARDTAPGSASLVGVSLYTPRLDEISYPSRHWRPRWGSMAGAAPAMLMCLPGSWGALYFRRTWQRFVAFYAARAHVPFYNFSAEAHQKGKLEKREVLGDPALAITGCRASTWPRSWKRFMVDFMYGRGDVMLYPNAPRDGLTPYTSYSYSTTYMERGAHSGTDGVIESEPEDRLRPSAEYDRRKTVALAPMSKAVEMIEAMAHLPPLVRLPVIDLLHRRAPSGLSGLAVTGRDFVRRQVPKTAATAEQQRGLQDLWLHGSRPVA